MQFDDGSQIKLEPSADMPIIYTQVQMMSPPGQNYTVLSLAFRLTCTPYRRYTGNLPDIIQHKLAVISNAVATLATSTIR